MFRFSITLSGNFSKESGVPLLAAPETNEEHIKRIPYEEDTFIILHWWELTQLWIKGFFMMPKFDEDVMRTKGVSSEDIFQKPTRYMEKVLDFHYGNGPIPTIIVERDKSGKWDLVSDPMMVYAVLGWIGALWWGSVRFGGHFTYHLSSDCKYKDYRGKMYGTDIRERALPDSKLKAVDHGKVKVIIKPGKLTEEESKRLVPYDKALISTCEDETYYARKSIIDVPEDPPSSPGIFSIFKAWKERRSDRRKETY